MKLDMPITGRKIKNHFQYSFWKYALLVILAVFGWNLLYTTTRYRVPENKKLEFYADGAFSVQGTQEAMDALMAVVHRDVAPEMEEVSYTALTMDQAYGDMQLTVWIGAGQGDVYLLGKERFQRLGGGGAFVDLQPYVDSGALAVEGVDLAAGRVRDEETGKTILYGIPAGSLVGLEACGVYPKDTLLSVLASSGNQEESIRLINYLFENMR